MSQLHGVLTATQLAAATEVTWLIGSGCRTSLMPACAAFNCSSLISDASQPRPLAYGKLKLRVFPGAIPGPHLAGSTQLVLPPGTAFQPWLDDSALALATLNGNRSPCLPFGDRNFVTGTRPTGFPPGQG